MMTSLTSATMKPSLTNARVACRRASTLTSTTSSIHGHLVTTSKIFLAPKKPAGILRQGLRGVVCKTQTFSSFDEMVQKSEKPVLVDFYAVWCGPCHMMSQTMASVSGELKEKVLMVKIDTEKYPDLATRFRVEGLPTLAVFHKGECVARIEGALPAGDLLRWVGEVTTGLAR